MLLPRISLLGLLLLVVSSAQANETNPAIPGPYDSAGTESNRAYTGADSEVIDPFAGALQLMYSDLAVPSAGDINISPVRTYSPFDATEGYGVGRKFRARTLNGVGWDMHYGRVWGYGEFDDACRSETIHVGRNPVFELPDGSRKVLANAAPGIGYDYITKDHWKASCIQTTRVENGTTHIDLGLQITSSSGVIYTVDRLLPVSNGGSQPMALHVTRIEDRNGNWAQFNYAPATNPFGILESIETSHGATLTFQYINKNAGNAHLTGYTFNNRSYTFEYTDVPGHGGAYQHLYRVNGPEGLSWTYDYYGDASVYSGLVRSVTNPYGGVTTYEYQQVRFMSDLQQPGLAILHKDTSGPNVVPGRWTYEFTPGAPYDTTRITSPSDIKVYRHYSMRGATTGNIWKIGLLRSLEHRDLDDNLMRTDSYSSWGTIHISSQNDYRPQLGALDIDFAKAVLLAKEVEQNGRVYTTTYGDYNQYGAVGTVVETGESTRTTVTNYVHNTEKWILNQLETHQVRAVDDGRIFPLTRRFYDESGNLDRQAANTDHFTHYTYHSDGNLHTVRDPRGYITTYSDYKFGIARSVALPESIHVSAVVNAYGEISEKTNGEGDITTLHYDGLGRLVNEVFPEGSPRTHEYNFAARRKVISQGPNQTIEQMDGAGNILWRAQVDTLTGETIRQDFTMDASGRIVFESLANDPSRGSRITFDGLGRTETLTQAGDRQQRWDYLPENKVAVTDARGHITTSTYISFGDPSETRLTRIESPDGGITRVKLNDFGQLMEVNQSDLRSGRRFHYWYNTLIAEEIIGENITWYNRDANGNLLDKQTYRYPPTNNNINLDYFLNGGYTTSFIIRDIDSTKAHLETLVREGPMQLFTYDGNNLVVKKEIGYTVHGSLYREQVEDFTYDDNGNLTRVENKNAVRTLGYNRNNLLTSESLTVADRTFALTYERNDLGFVDRLIYPSQNTIDYAPNSFGWPTKVGDIVDAVSYHPSGSISGIDFTNGVSLTRTYKPENQHVDEEILSDHSSSFIHRQFAYDKNSNVEYILDKLDSTQDYGLGYDSMDRLTEAFWL
ncbi:hypothetical protein GCM10022278_11340 [Allohahella marinimesophila]|uniref:YD repeat-containing protein n=2 Tax=Allohahella marinimesophila TaxID=1054972 RepID=A0ABP7NUJ2_9GAMM